MAVLATAGRRSGGTLPYTLSMIQALRRLPADTYRFSIFVAPENHEFDRLGLPIVRLTGPLAVLASALHVRDMFDGMDCVVAPVYSSMLLASTRPFAFTLHDLQERYYPEHFTMAQRLWRRFANAALVARARAVICESNFVRRDIDRFFGFAGGKVVVLPAPPMESLGGCELTASDLTQVRQKYDLPSTYLFYPAQFWPHKNHRRLVGAFAKVAAQHPEATLLLTGRPEREYQATMDHVKTLGLAQKVRHIGYVDNSELAALYRLATIAVIPTLFESISIPVYEAFSIGTPLCASNVVGLPEQIGDAGLLFDPTSEQDIADKLLRLLDSPELRTELVRRGRLRMIAMTHERYGRSLRELIDSLVSKGL